MSGPGGSRNSTITATTHGTTQVLKTQPGRLGDRGPPPSPRRLAAPPRGRLGRAAGLPGHVSVVRLASPRQARGSRTLGNRGMQIADRGLGKSRGHPLSEPSMEDAWEDPTTFTAQSLPSDPRLLATVTNAYLGTRDLWMFPKILMFHPEAARAILEYRIRTLSGALENARNLGYQGAKFAWESAGSGLEVCPEDIYGAQEIHINGAVLLAFQLYYYTTQDLQLFREAGGWDVVSAVAEFWCSRVEWSAREKQYHLRGVMPPDEYHSGVNNSTYTNVLVQTSLHFAAGLAEDLGLPVPNQWLVVADKIKVPFDPERNFHPEFDGYEPGEEVKQADVVLLGYPVPFPLPPDVRRKNLETYEAVTSPQGPAMTWSMFAVGWMELKDPLRARRLLDRSFTNVTEPFKVWTENADGSGAVNFLTGMGGFLQAVLFGSTGLRVTKAGMTFDPLCPAGVSGVCVSGVSYQGNKLNFVISEDSMTVEVTAQAGPRAPLLEAELWPSQVRLPLLPGHKASFPPLSWPHTKITPIAA
ncbi:LOW QUALITY PROTEIN: protein-glucosylgalactosylhydroxylysine glucosidase [Callospermophilus lateralis]